MQVRKRPQVLCSDDEEGEWQDEEVFDNDEDDNDEVN